MCFKGLARLKATEVALESTLYESQCGVSSAFHHPACRESKEVPFVWGILDIQHCAPVKAARVSARPSQ